MIAPHGNKLTEAQVAELFNDKSAADYIGGIEARTIRDWRVRRGLPFLRLTSKIVRIRKSDLDAWLAKHLERRGAA